MRPTIKDVAKIAGVSPSTVSRVISDSPKISQKTKEKVYRAMKEINYYPNSIAQSLAKKNTKTLGIILPSSAEDLFNNYFFIQVLRAISLHAQERNYFIMYIYSDTEEKEINHLKNLVNSNRVDGNILLTVREDDKSIKFLESVNHPFVIIGRPDNLEDNLWVDNDNVYTMYKIIDNIIKEGYKKIAFLGGSSKLNVTRDRFEGYKKALENKNLPIDEDLVLEAEFTEEKGYQAINSLLKKKIPEYIVTTDDLLAFGALKALKENGLGHIKIMGFNNTPLAKYQDPPLASVDINADKLGFYATKLLIDKLEGLSILKNHHIVETNIVYR